MSTKTKYQPTDQELALWRRAQVAANPEFAVEALLDQGTSGAAVMRAALESGPKLDAPGFAIGDLAHWARGGMPKNDYHLKIEERYVDANGEWAYQVRCQYARGEKCPQTPAREHELVAA